jgi:hypothetical protein
MSRSNKPYISAAAGVVIVTLSELAAAQSLPPVASGSVVHTDSAAATQLINVTSLSQMLTISNALSARTMTRTGPGMTADAGQRFGMAAGGAADKWNVWASLSGDRNTYDNGNGGYRFGASATNWVAGGDYALSPTLNLGLSVAERQHRLTIALPAIRLRPILDGSSARIGRWMEPWDGVTETSVQEGLRPVKSGCSMGST